MASDIGNTTPVKGVSAGAILGTAIATLFGIAAVTLWKMSQVPKESKLADTGTKTPDGKAIVEVTGVGGVDSGKKVRGYILPSKIEEVKTPITVVIRPNQELFLELKVGDEVTFTKKLNDELVWVKTTGDVTGDYTVWYPELLKKVLGKV
jgi:hypothetical protein